MYVNASHFVCAFYVNAIHSVMGKKLFESKYPYL